MWYICVSIYVLCDDILQSRERDQDWFFAVLGDISLLNDNKGNESYLGCVFSVPLLPLPWVLPLVVH